MARPRRGRVGVGVRGASEMFIPSSIAVWENHAGSGALALDPSL